VNEDNYVCLDRSFNKKCPICQYREKLKKSGEASTEELRLLNPKRRAIYNVHVLDSDKERSKGVQTWDVSHYLFERLVIELAEKKKGGGENLFADPDKGKSISFRKKGSGLTTTEYSAFSFEEREEAVSDEILDQAVTLDEFLNIPSYEEVKAAFESSFEEETSPTEKEEEDEGYKARDRKSKDSDPEPEEGRRSRRSKEPEPEEDIPEPEIPTDECPHELNFGEDFDTEDVCEECKVKEYCKERYEEIKEEKRKARQKAREDAEKETKKESEKEPEKETRRTPLRRSR